METNGDRKQRNREMNRLLGRRLATMRATNRIRQEGVADAMGFMRPLVSKIESGKRALHATEIPAYSCAIGVTPQEVLDAILDIEAEFDAGNRD